MSEEETLPASSLVTEGSLEGDSIPDLLHRLSRARATGLLRVEQDGAARTLYLEAGRIVFAVSEDASDLLGEMLLRQGRIRVRDLDDAIQHLGKGKRLGTLLVESGALPPDDLVRGVIDQVRTIALSLFSWERGRYFFEEGALPSQEVITLNLPTAELILEGVREVRSWERVRRAVGPPRTLLEREDTDGRVPDLRALGATESAILEALDQSRTVEELCREVFASSFEVYRSLWALHVLGLVRRARRYYPEPSPDVVPRAGRLETAEPAAVLLSICRAGETGLLRVWSAEGERTVHVKDGSVVFATSSDPNDSLVSYLLRRGVIGVSDRDQAARRLLSRKRIGTLLVEGGALSPKELEKYVREQVSEVVQRMLAWNHGEFAFEEGELPTLEEITLDQSVETLVLGAVLRVPEWARVSRGLGGFDTYFRLKPDYLDVLDRMEIGPSEWDVISLLRTEQPVAEICGASPLSDFRTCQVLWALRLVGVAENVPAEEVEERERREEQQRAEEEVLAATVKLAPPTPASPPAEPAPEEAPAEEIPEEVAEALAEAVAPPVQASPVQAVGFVEEQVEPFEALDPGPVPEDVELEGEAVIEDDPVTMEPPPLEMRGEPAEAVAEPRPEDPLEREIRRFNEKHRFLFDYLKAEIGAGARNFVVTCQRSDEGAFAMFSGLFVGPEGEYDPDQLRRNICDHNVEDYPGVFDALVRTEFGMVRDLLPPDLLRRIESGLREIDQRYSA